MYCTIYTVCTIYVYKHIYIVCISIFIEKKIYAFITVGYRSCGRREYAQIYGTPEDTRKRRPKKKLEKINSHSSSLQIAKSFAIKFNKKSSDCAGYVNSMKLPSGSNSAPRLLLSLLFLAPFSYRYTFFFPLIFSQDESVSPRRTRVPAHMTARYLCLPFCRECGGR